MLYIRGLPLDELLFHLWYRAKYVGVFTKIANKPIATLQDCKLCVAQLAHEETINLTSFFGKKLFIEFDKEYLEHQEYDDINAQGAPLAQAIVRHLKIHELSRAAALYVANFSIDHP